MSREEENSSANRKQTFDPLRVHMLCCRVEHNACAVCVSLQAWRVSYFGVIHV